MNYPIINNEKLDVVNRRRFDAIYAETKLSIEKDNEDNGLKLQEEDIQLLSWNVATALLEGVL
jgi:hypothetical protein